MLVVTLIAFTIMALLLFGHASTLDSKDKNAVNEGSQVFPNFVTGMENLLVLATTANNPTVMMPAFAQNRLYALFFMFYLLISLVFTNILIAILYHHFNTFFRNSVGSSILRRRVAFRACFSCLQELETKVSNFSMDPDDVISVEIQPDDAEQKVHSSKIENCIRSCKMRVS